MELKYNVTGTKRKELAKAVSEITGEELRYLGVPTFNYEAGYFTIDRFGTVSFDDMADTEVIEDLIEKLCKMGFEAEPAEEYADAEETNTIAISMPLNKVNVENLKKILDAKSTLIKKALGISSLQIEVADNKVSFPWFSELSPNVANIYSRFITALCEMSMKLKRVTSKEKEVVNDKYAFRCFLLRLGFIGSQFKAERKELLKNLSGNSAFRNGAEMSA